MTLALLVPAVLLSGCGMLSSSSSSGAGSSSSPPADGSGRGDSWIVTDFGKATPSPTPSSAPPARRASASRRCATSACG